MPETNVIPIPSRKLTRAKTPPPTTKPRPRKKSQSPEMAALSRLHDRDSDIVRAVYDHGPLTPSHLQVLFFGLEPAKTAAKRRAKQLTEMGVLTRYRGPKLGGEYEYVLGPLGIRMVAESKGRTVKQLDYHPIILDSRVRKHRLDINDFFCALGRACRERNIAAGIDESPDARQLPVIVSPEYPNGLLEWVGERGCRERFGGLGNVYGESPDVIPDGFARVRIDRREVQLVAEVDRGTETIRRLRAKAMRYKWLGDEDDSRVCFVMAESGDPHAMKAKDRVKMFMDPDNPPEGRVAATTLGEHRADPLGEIWLLGDGRKVGLSEV